MITADQARAEGFDIVQNDSGDYYWIARFFVQRGTPCETEDQALAELAREYPLIGIVD